MNVSASIHRFLRVVLTAALGLAMAWPSALFAKVSINVAAGYLRTGAGTALPAQTSSPSTGSGALLLLVAAGGNAGTTFTNTLSPGQYVAGGDVIVAAFEFNNAGGASRDGTGQTTTNSLASFALPTGATPGAEIELRWFANITFGQYNTVFPSAGSTYGNYNPQIYGNSSTAPDGGNPWVVPTDGSSGYQLSFFTKDNIQKTSPAGSQTATEGYASFTVVPEPSNIAMLVAGSAVLAMLCHRKLRMQLGQGRFPALSTRR